MQRIVFFHFSTGQIAHLTSHGRKNSTTLHTLYHTICATRLKTTYRANHHTRCSCETNEIKARTSPTDTSPARHQNYYLHCEARLICHHGRQLRRECPSWLLLCFFFTTALCDLLMTKSRQILERARRQARSNYSLLNCTNTTACRQLTPQRYSTPRAAAIRSAGANTISLSRDSVGVCVASLLQPHTYR